ncbi:MAG: cation:proton antiporter [Williamsia sp.]|nr:cation:proton antiporter [Williamsia sp.]
MMVVWIIAAVLLMAAAIITTARILLGPNTLDRLVALDTLIALSMCSLGVWAAYSLDSTVVPAIVALSLLSFVGSVAIARFRVRDDVVRAGTPASDDVDAGSPSPGSERT